MEETRTLRIDELDVTFAIKDSGQAMAGDEGPDAPRPFLSAIARLRVWSGNVSDDVTSLERLRDISDGNLERLYRAKRSTRE